MSNPTALVRNLPTWDEMSDLDKGAALLHVWKLFWEGAAYAIAEYPARYFEHPDLVALDSRTASTHAAHVTGGNEAIHTHLGTGEYERLYDLALDTEHERRRTAR